MAAGRLSEPGTEYGPCVEPCEHTDCAATRRMAETMCDRPACGEPIGYDRGFYALRTPGSDVERLVHAACLEDFGDETP